MNTIIFSFALLAATPEAAAGAVVEVADERYQACVAGVDKNAEAVRARAEEWIREGGGAAALHCQAMGDLAAGFPGLAAIRLEEVAARPDAGDDLVRARLLSQAALAWLEAERPDAAKGAIEEALAYAPQGGELYLSAALVHLASAEYQATIAAVDEAEALGATSAEGYAARARARFALTNYREAANDVVAALSIDPTNLDALVVRGELFQHGIEIDAYYESRN